MTVTLTVLCENTVGRPSRAIGEHGFSCLIETPEGNYLFDTGQGLGLRHNAEILGKKLSSIRGIVLSHGHIDHTGGLVKALGEVGNVDIFAHPEIFRRRYWVGMHERRSIGIPFLRERLEELGARFVLERDFVRLTPRIWLTGEVPRTTSFERRDPHLMAREEGGGPLVPDLFSDDLSLVIDSPRGLVVVLGCAHAGLINILRHVVEKTGRRDIHAVIGGTHLGPAGDEQFTATLAALKTFGVEKIGVSHCTGQGRAAQLQAEFPGRFFFASVGAVLEL